MKKIYSKETLVKFLNSRNNEGEIDLQLYNGSIEFKNGIETIEYILNNFDDFKKSVKNVTITIPYEKLPRDVFAHICELNKKLEDNNIQLDIGVNHTFDYGYTRVQTLYWDVNTIIKANTEINKVCDFIKEKNFSPLEALAYVHDYVSTITAYKQTGEKHAWYDKDQHFAGAFLNLPEFVCMGYSTLMKEIIDNLNMPGLSCDVIVVEFNHLKKSTLEGHARCFVKVKDDKYGVDQTAFDDPTWDNNKELNHEFAHFVMPNDAHDKKRSKMYEYDCPEKVIFSNKKASIEIADDYLYSERYNHSKNQIDQLMIEKVYFNILKKSNKNASFDEIYNILTKMVKDSFAEQEQREYEGNLISNKPLLSREEAAKDYKLDDNIEEENLI